MVRKIVLCFLIIAGIAFSAEARDHLKKFRDRDEIKVYLKDVVNKTKSDLVSPEAFRKVFDAAMAARVKVKFEVVGSEAEADVVIDAAVKTYVFKAKVMPRFYSTYALVADATAPKSFAKVIVDYKVYEARTGKKLLEFPNFTTEERLPVDMMAETGPGNAALKKSIDRFVFKAFYKGRRGTEVEISE